MNQTNIHTQTAHDKSWNPALKCFVFEFAFVFDSRGLYREFVLLWKENYAGISLTIREQKHLVSATLRKRESAGKHQLRLLELKQEATLQLAMRRAAKVESNRQYLAAKQLMV